MNLYAYVGNDPINMIDPSGMCSQENSESEVLCKVEDTIKDVLEPIIESIMEAAGEEVVPEGERDPEGVYEHEAPENDIKTEVIAIGMAIVATKTGGDENDSYTGHGDNPEGQTGSGSKWQKHSDKRAGKRYGAGRNKKRGSKNKKYIKPPNPNKKKKN